MKKVIELTASQTGKISTGSYENEAPFFSIKEVYELLDGEVLTDEFVAERHAELHLKCVEQFNKRAEKAFYERLEKEYQHLRFYEIDGKKFPSVTSIINYCNGMPDFFVPPDKLAEAGARGELVHKLVEEFLKEGKWNTDKYATEMGVYGISPDAYNFPSFFAKYPFKVLQLEETVVNQADGYAGRLDILCEIENKGDWAKVEGIKFGVPTVLDVKSGQIDAMKCFKQGSAYAKCVDAVQVGVIPLNADTKQGFSKPIIDDASKYYPLFTRDLQTFRKRFGL